MTSAVLFEDIFKVKDVDPHGKKFDRVSRFICEGDSFQVEMVVDINTQLFALALGDSFMMCLAKTLQDDGKTDTGEYNQSHKHSMADAFDYVMHGTIYKVEQDEATSQLSIFVSFGGLLMRIRGEASNLNKPGMDLDHQLYFLIRKN